MTHAPAADQSSHQSGPGVEATDRLVDILIVVAVSGVAFLLEHLAIGRGWIPFAEEVRGVTAVLAGAVASVGVVLARGGTLRDLGFKRPERWAVVPIQVAAILAAFIAAQFLAPLIVSSFVPLPEPDFSRYDSIAGNLGAAIAMALILPVTASIPEEIIYRGFLIGRLSAVFTEKRGGAIAAVTLQAMVFGAIHFQWGLGGMIMTFIMGMVWGIAYLWCDRNLWIVILAHSAGHILFVIQLYLGESIIV